MSEFIEDFMERRRRTYPLESEENRARLRSQLRDLEERNLETRSALAGAIARGPSTRGELADAGYGVPAKDPIEMHIVRYDTDGKPYSANPEMVRRAEAADAEERTRRQAWLEKHRVLGVGPVTAYAFGPLDQP